MAQKSKDKGNINDWIREAFSKVPDPLHFELPHNHKKLLEVIYIIGVVGAIILIIILERTGMLSVEQRNASTMMIMFLSLLFAIMIIEKSMIVHPQKSLAHKRTKSSS